MGGRPVAAVVSIACDPSLRTAWLEGFYRALAAESRRLGVPVVGGDIARLRGGFIATLTLIGRCAGPRAVTRHGARRGDWIYVTGDLGGSLEGKH
jgi:thiamine-monophosphate kinase